MPEPAAALVPGRTRRAVVAGALVAALAPLRAAEPSHRPRIGVLSFGVNASSQAVVPVLRDALVALGWTEGRTAVIEWRTAAGRPDRLGPLAEELVRLPCDVLVAGGPAPAAAL